MSRNEALACANATLIAISTGCMVAGVAAVRRRDITRHRNLMLAAFGTAALFMVLFVLRFVAFGFRKFDGHGVWRGLYLAIFFSHEPIAVVSVPLVVVTLVFGLRRSVAIHRELASMAYPVWLYASVTGVLLYALLYWFPAR